MLTAEELHRRGVREMNAGRLGAAGRLLRRALERTDDPDLRARVSASLAYVELDASDLASGLTMIDGVLAHRDLDPTALGVLLAQRAVILRRSGEPRRALGSFGEAIDRLGDAPEHLGKAYLNRGTVHLDLGELASAEDDFAAAAGAYARAGLEVARAKAEHNRGYVQFLRGDLVGALQAMEAAHDVVAREGPCPGRSASRIVPRSSSPRAWSRPGSSSCAGPPAAMASAGCASVRPRRS